MRGWDFSRFPKTPVVIRDQLTHFIKGPVHSSFGPFRAMHSPFGSCTRPLALWTIQGCAPAFWPFGPLRAVHSPYGPFGPFRAVHSPFGPFRAVHLPFGPFTRPLDCALTLWTVQGRALALWTVQGRALAL
jgi:hypothetical protein